MNTNIRNRSFVVLALALALMAMISSCNRGVGCPSEFSVEQATLEVVTPV